MSFIANLLCGIRADAIDEKVGKGVGICCCSPCMGIEGLIYLGAAVVLPILAGVGCILTAKYAPLRSYKVVCGLVGAAVIVAPFGGIIAHCKIDRARDAKKSKLVEGDPTVSAAIFGESGTVSNSPQDAAKAAVYGLMALTFASVLAVGLSSWKWVPLSGKTHSFHRLAVAIGLIFTAWYSANALRQAKRARERNRLPNDDIYSTIRANCFVLCKKPIDAYNQALGKGVSNFKGLTKGHEVGDDGY